MAKEKKSTSKATTPAASAETKKSAAAATAAATPAPEVKEAPKDKKAPKEATAKEKKESGPKPKSKSVVYKEIAEATKLETKQVAAVFEALTEFIKKELSAKGTGVVALPGLMKLQRIDKPATKATKKPNPFKPGEMMEVKAKPKRTYIKMRILKLLKELISK